MSSARSCGTCGLANGDKYKCSACRTFKYCSVACYKKHQEAGCTKGAAPATNQTTGGAAPPAATAATPASTPAAATTAAATAASVLPRKADSLTVAPADLDALARDPLTLGALASDELRRILHLIDSGGATNGPTAAAGEAAVAAATLSTSVSDEARMQLLEKYRRANPEFEQFVQHTLQVINQETR